MLEDRNTYQSRYQEMNVGTFWLKRFNELRDEDLNLDYHIHTVQTDGQAGIEDYILEAKRKGLREIAFTEHVWKSTLWFDSFVDSILKFRIKYKNDLGVRYGIEAKVINYRGDIDASEDMIMKSEIVLGTVHRYPSSNGGYLDYRRLSHLEAAKIECELACAILRNPSVDVLAHPGGFYEKYYHSIYPRNLLERILIEANHTGKAIEVNSSYIRDAPSYIELLRKHDPRISLGSDAHDLEHLGKAAEFLRNIFNEE